MPTPERTSLDAIVAAGRDLLEHEGPAGLTMQAVASRVGVKAPSLYKRVRDRDALLELVVVATVDDLTARLVAAPATLEAVARGFRAFAQERPAGFRLAMSAGADPDALARAAGPVLRATEALVGPDDALAAARLVTAWVTGFLTMELAGAFRLGGSVEEAFDYGLAHLVAGLSSDRERPS
ncbi:TetR/AcrR family transcriptional regulator [Cellulomonas endophytica]|uniref:TetR/AcrR family transcriptional regulator n=1 Tax=Cellulomonas endophytica TaxID=2494735 RepID=UPI0010110750|nr:TetR/AcrR family transcriptional regulator [Cellulomonas endophytica]